MIVPMIPFNGVLISWLIATGNWNYKNNESWVVWHGKNHKLLNNYIYWIFDFFMLSGNDSKVVKTL